MSGVGNIGQVPDCRDIVLDIMARQGYLKEHIVVFDKPNRIFLRSVTSDYKKKCSGEGDIWLVHHMSLVVQVTKELLDNKSN